LFTNGLTDGRTDRHICAERQTGHKKTVICRHESENYRYMSQYMS